MSTGRDRRRRRDRAARGQYRVVFAEDEAARRAERVRKRKRRRVTAYSLFVTGGLVAVSHLLEHLGVIRLMNPTAEDLLLGYPMASVLLVAGAISLGP